MPDCFSCWRINAAHCMQVTEKGSVLQATTQHTSEWVVCVLTLKCTLGLVFLCKRSTTSIMMYECTGMFHVERRCHASSHPSAGDNSVIDCVELRQRLAVALCLVLNSPIRRHVYAWSSVAKRWDILSKNVEWSETDERWRRYELWVAVRPKNMEVGSWGRPDKSSSKQEDSVPVVPCK